MVIFRDENYLQNAVLQKRNIQSQCLLTVPSHCIDSDLYPHKGEVADTAYRFLWKKIKSDDEFLKTESLKHDSDVAKLSEVSKDTSHYESFDNIKCTDSTFNGCINFNLHCDVIPFSNPGSPDLFVTIDENCNAAYIFDDNYCKEDLQLFSVSNENLKLETILKSSDKPEKQRCLVPGLTKLMARLKSMVTTDPLTDKNGCIPKEKNIFRESLLFSLKGQDTETRPLDIHVIDDVFEKDSKSGLPKENELENVITPSLYLPRKRDVYDALLTSVGCSSHLLTPLQIAKDKSVKEEVDSKVVTDTKDASASMLPFTKHLLEDEEVTFLDVNEPVVTDIDSICEDALLDVPVTISQEQHISIDFPECKPLELCLSAPKLLDSKERKCLERMCFSSEFYCNEIQAFRLAEPYRLEVETELRVPDIPTEQVKTVCYLERQIIASLELELSWDIAKISDLRKDPTHTFEKLPVKNQEILFSNVNEIFTTANPEDFCGLDLPEDFDTEDCLENAEESAESRDQPKIPSQTEVSTFYQSESNNVMPSGKITNADLQKSEDNAVRGMPEKGLEQKQEIKIGDGQKPVMTGIGTDPLGDFMALRLKRNVTCKQTEETAVTRERNKPISDEVRDDVGLNSKHSAARKGKTKHHVITVRLSESYQKLVSLLEDSALNYLTLLQTSSEVTRSCSFKTLSPDVTRFLIKQREKFLKDHDVEATADDTYSHILCLHGLTWAAEILVNGCLESALGFLNAITDRYKEFIQNLLEPVLIRICQSCEKFGQQQILHPKMTALCKEIEVWLKKKRAKSRDNEQNILITVRRNLPHLKNTLKKVLSSSKILQPEVVDTDDSDALIDCLDAHNCLIIHTNLIGNSFPWAQFSLVVEYEHQESLEWRDHCERQNIRHMSVKVEQDIQKEQCDFQERSSECYERQIALIASQKVTANSALLQTFESRFSIQLYERDYTLLDGNQSQHFSDFDIDESTAVIVEDISHLREDRSIHNVVTRIVALSLKYLTCFCLFYTMEKSGSTGYQYPGHVVANLCKLQAACLNFESKCNTNYRTKIMICPDVHNLAAVIRRISEDTMKSQTHRTMEEWLDRSWLTLDVTQEEKFLLQSPCISSFSAQVMLQQIGLQGILRSSLDELLRSFPGISKIGLQKFHESLHKWNPRCKIQRTTQTEIGRCTITAEIRKDNELKLQSTRNMHMPQSDFDKSTTNDHLKFHNKKNPEKSQLAIPLDSKSPVENYRGHTDVSDIYRQAKPLSNQEVLTYPPSAVLNRQRASIHRASVDKAVPLSVDSNKRCRFGPDNEKGYAGNLNSSVLQFSNIDGADLGTLKNQQCPEKLQEWQRTFDFLNKKEMSSNPAQLKEASTKGKLEFSNQIFTSAEQSFRKFYRSKQLENFYKQVGPADIPGDISKASSNDEQQPAQARNSVTQDVNKNSCGGSIQTFEYNHGLPKSAANGMQHYDRLAVNVTDDEALVKRRDLKKQLSALIIQEFPPSHEINKTLESGCKTVVEDGHSPIQFRIGLTDDSSSHFKCNARQTYQSDNENKMPASNELCFVCNGSSTVFNEPGYSNICFKQKGNDSFVEKSNHLETLQSWPQSKNNNTLCDTQYTSQPQMLASMSKGLDQPHFYTFAQKSPETFPTENSIMRPNSYDTCLNPNMQRISLRPNCLPHFEQGPDVDGNINNKSFEENLREATRRFLQNSEELPRFSNNTNRYPIQKKSIGLAQPLQREKVVAEIRQGRSVPAWTSEENWRMKQSLWATEGSPPMDLDYEDSQFKLCLNSSQNFTGETNTEVFYSQTPEKKRRLTYQRIPGKKGQTKLIFK